MADTARPPEHFTTDRLILRKPVAADARAVFEGYATDPEVVRYLLWRATAVCDVGNPAPRAG